MARKNSKDMKKALSKSQQQQHSPSKYSIVSEISDYHKEIVVEKFVSYVAEDETAVDQLVSIENNDEYLEEDMNENQDAGNKTLIINSDTNYEVPVSNNVLAADEEKTFTEVGNLIFILL